MAGFGPGAHPEKKRPVEVGYPWEQLPVTREIFVWHRRPSSDLTNLQSSHRKQEGNPGAHGTPIQAQEHSMSKTCGEKAASPL